jgi:hypothetical protein
MKKPASKWIKAIVVLFIAGLFYAVYFTKLGKPESSESPRNITLYDRTAISTIFVKEAQALTVELDWAYANQDLLKFAIKIRGLETTDNLGEWICDPYITMDEPIQYQLRSGSLGPVYDASGEFIQAVYEYEVNAGDYDSLKVDLDLTIGPCGEQFNFQENNITPLARTSLIGNYHLTFQVPVKISTPSPLLTLTPQSMAMSAWEDIPVYPGALEVEDDTIGYHYSVDKINPHTVMLYYRSKMRDTSWKLLSIADVSGVNLGPGYTLSYARGKDVLQIDIFIKAKVTYVVLHIE